MFIHDPQKLAAAIAKAGPLDNISARALIENYAHGGHDSRTHRMVVINGVGVPVPNNVADEITSLRARLGSVQRELSDRIRADNMGRNSHSLT